MCVIFFMLGFSHFQMALNLLIRIWFIFVLQNACFKLLFSCTEAYFIIELRLLVFIEHLTENLV
jgi:hypothetical protein